MVTKVQPKQTGIERIRTTEFDSVGLPGLYIKWRSVAYMPWATMRQLFPKEIAQQLDTDTDYALREFAKNLIVEWNIPDENDAILPLPSIDPESITMVPSVVAWKFTREVYGDISKISFQ